MKMLTRKFLLNLLLFGVVFVVCLKVGDVVVGGVLDIKKSQNISLRNVVLREPAPNYARLMTPDQETLASSDRMEAKSVHYRVDQDGFILGPNSSGDKVDMVFVGGSTTECAYVDEGLRFPFLVSTLLKKTGGEQVRTLNAGYSGNNAMHSLIVILAKVLPYRPKFIVVMHNINDLSLLNKSGSYWLAPQSRALVQYSNKQRISMLSSLSLAVKDWLIPNSWQLVKPYVGKWFVPKLVDEFADYRSVEVDSVPFEESSRQFYSALKTIVFTARAWGIEPILMTQFNRLQSDDVFVMNHSGMSPDEYGKFVGRYKEFNEIVRNVAREEKVKLIDLDREVPRSSQYMVDSVHLNNEGSMFVANVIARDISHNFAGFVTQSPREDTSP